MRDNSVYVYGAILCTLFRREMHVLVCLSLSIIILIAPPLFFFLSFVADKRQDTQALNNSIRVGACDLSC